MDESLQRLARELRRETCPQRVLDEVARRISTPTRPPARSRFRYALAALTAGAALLCGIVILRRPEGGNAQRQTVPVPPTGTDSRQVALQAEGALGYVGSILRDAGARSGHVILKGAVPPLRNSLETAKKKTLDRI